MSQNSIFDAEILVPSAEIAARAQTLIGFESRYYRVHDQLRLLLNADAVAEWNRRHHRGELAVANRIADQYPLVIFHGDVGTGKTAMAEAIANRLMTEARAEDSMIFRLSNRVRGTGMVGEMGSLLSEAFTRVTAAVGKHRRGVLIIDEGDSIAASRSQEHSHHEDKVAVNTLIQHIDDLRRLKGRVAVILCTNRLSVVDAALLRRAAIIEEFRRPSDIERQHLLQTDLDGLRLNGMQIADLVRVTGPSKGLPGWTFSDFRTRFYPAAVAKAFPDKPLTFQLLLDTAQQMGGSRVMEDR
jgi:SpoVK/Ycf46/Vps4 family AAA+-type ATPase